MPVSRRLEPDVRDHDVARLEEPGRDREPDLAAVEGDRERLRARPRPAISPVEASTPEGMSTATTGRRCGVDPLDRRRRLLARRAVEAGPEERVDDHVRLLDRGRLDRVAALLAEDPGGDPPVAAVRAAAADDGDPARVGKRCMHLARDRRAGALHQLRDVVPGLLAARISSAL